MICLYRNDDTCSELEVISIITVCVHYICGVWHSVTLVLSLQGCGMTLSMTATRPSSSGRMKTFKDSLNLNLYRFWHICRTVLKCQLISSSWMQRNLQLMNVPDMKLYSLFVFMLSQYCTTVMSPEETLITFAFYLLLIYILLILMLLVILLVFWTIHLQSSNIRTYSYAIFSEAFFMLYVHCWVNHTLTT